MKISLRLFNRPLLNFMGKIVRYDIHGLSQSRFR